MCACLHACVRACVRACVCVCMCVCACVRAYVHACVHARARVCQSVCVRARAKADLPTSWDKNITVHMQTCFCVSEFASTFLFSPGVAINQE